MRYIDQQISNKLTLKTTLTSCINIKLQFSLKTDIMFLYKYHVDR